LGPHRDAGVLDATTLPPSGMTNVTIGMMWGWHTLTPGEPFTQAQVVKPAQGRFHPDRRVTLRRTDFAQSHARLRS
jgi:hypothetical protein